jgi:protein-S-isoprenylcysteine O-methyltransferase Ste14
MNFSRISGGLLAVVSLIFLLTSRAQLGKSFAVTPKAKDLVTHGLYSKFRNPMYLFVDLTILGVALAIGWWYVVLILLILVPLQAMNSRRERKVLHDKFGERYEEYRRSTWF